MKPPAPITSPSRSDDRANAAVAPEAIAHHVPAECFYVRFGSLQNFLWVQDLNERWQGDLQNMVLGGAIRSGAVDRLTAQLAIRQNALTRIMGPQVVADVALIGLDPYLREGAGVGMVFHAKNSFLLRQTFTSQRRAAKAKLRDAFERTVEVAGRDVSLIATPRGEIRSYFVSDGHFHLVSTSRRLVQRFLEAGQGNRSLANSPGFRHARRRVPAQRNERVFAYSSPEFFKNLASPAYWIERRRRIESTRQILLLELVRYQAIVEGISADTAKDWIRAGLLPSRFLVRHDGSELVRGEDGRYYDSLRGSAGFMLPIADVELTDCTTPESELYQL
ncbi:MAG: hypothetical protein AAF961_19355, partial [Planctomycetota bacterium]